MVLAFADMGWIGRRTKCRVVPAKAGTQLFNLAMSIGEKLDSGLRRNDKR
jgi:hypothetical protein